MTMLKAPLTVLVILASLTVGFTLVPFSIRKIPERRNVRCSNRRRSCILLHLHQGESNNGDSNPSAGDEFLGSNVNNPLDSMVAFEEMEPLEFNTSSMVSEETTGSTQDLGNNVTETIVAEAIPDSIAQLIDAFVSIKESAYRFLRKILSDLVTIIRRSAQKARDWAVDDEVGQLVSSALFLVGFFASVAAFAAWNITVLSGGKSQWSGPQNGVTVPVIKGLPEPTTTTSPTTIRFQKPKWKAPKIQTSYATSDSVSSLREETTEMLPNRDSTR